MDLVQSILAGDTGSRQFYEVAESATSAEVSAVIALIEDPSPKLRLSAVQALPSLTRGDPPTDDLVRAAIRATTDADPRVRDWACFALARQWREIDTPELRDALAQRLPDDDGETAREALVGLANRRDERAYAVVERALARPDGELWLLELEAAGALADPRLHRLVLRHKQGWDDEATRVADAVRRLSDPDGPGDDVLDGVAQLYRDRAHDRAAQVVLEPWTIMLAMLELAPDRESTFRDAVRSRLDDDPAAQHEFDTQSAFAPYSESGDGNVEPGYGVAHLHGPDHDHPS